MSLLKILRDSKLMKIKRMIGFMNGTKMCHGYTKNHGQIMEHGRNPHQLHIFANLSIIRLDVQNGQPAAGENMDNDYEWYEALEDSELKEEALRNKAIMEGLINKDDESNDEGWKSWDNFKNTNSDHNEWEYENEHEDDERHELCGNETHELSVCTIRRFEIIKYLFEDDEEYVAVKEVEYDDLTSTSEDACRAYQEIFRTMDEGWMVTRTK
ncbi:hypothetical protein Tco_1031669 [Tanacetum coccineum]|uniref:Uncharacterized protein n=1 Tax=Tanacetum coccineum TaxID=301880 RepID=A0ABQ5GBB3_9ASTR